MQKTINHSRLSTYLLLFFTAALLVSTLFTEFFRPRVFREKESKKLFVNPIRDDILSNLKRISFKNNNGQFELEKKAQRWGLTKPILMNANTELINQFIKSFSALEVQTIFQKDEVNLQNFSLTQPKLEIDFHSLLDEKQKIQIGINNTIDKSSYILVDDKKAIFQVNSFKLGLSSLSLTDFVDTSIFAEKTGDIRQFKLVEARTSKVLHKLDKQGKDWKSNKYNTISNTSVESKIQTILDIKTKMIIDKVTPSTNTFISNYLEHPRYYLTIKTQNAQAKYIVTNPILANEELKIKKRENFLIQRVKSDNIYVVSKDFLSRFFIRYSDLKPK